MLAKVAVQEPESAAMGIDYRCVLVRRHTRTVLAIDVDGQDQLPLVRILGRTRPARELQSAIKSKWGLDTIILEIFPLRPEAEACMVAEVLPVRKNSGFKEVAAERILNAEFSEQRARQLELLLEGRNENPFSRLGWIDEAFAWMESGTGETFSSKCDVVQWNAGGGFVLLRGHSDTGRRYWLKATGHPNVQEFTITRLLSESFPDSLPRLLATRVEWNAWLMEDAGAPISDPPNSAELVVAAKLLANLQTRTIGSTDAIRKAGASDHRLAVLRSHIDEVIAYSIGAMKRQRSTKVSPLCPERMLSLGQTLHRVCLRMEALGIPDALLHNDLNTGNILSDGERCVFTDWSEPAVGNPFLACERLCQLNQAHAQSVRNAYKACWSPDLSSRTVSEALSLTPLIAVYAYLYGRGDWLGRTESVSPAFESYARSLVRHMDRAAQELTLREIPCA